MKYILIFILIVSGSASWAQEAGTIKVDIDPRVEQLIQKRNEQHKANGTIGGYRIQIYFGSSRTEALDARSKFEALYPNLGSYMIYQQPYFKVRIGDFRNRLEAYKIYDLIQKEFSSVFIVKDEIRFPNLVE